MKQLDNNYTSVTIIFSNKINFNCHTQQLDYLMSTYTWNTHDYIK